MKGRVFRLTWRDEPRERNGHTFQEVWPFCVVAKICATRNERQDLLSKSGSGQKRKIRIEPGAVVTTFWPGARETKRRPAVVISTNDYHAARPDVILAIITSQVEKADTDFDLAMFDWRDANL